MRILCLIAMLTLTLSFSAFADTHYPINLAMGTILYDDENEHPFVLKGNPSMSEWQFSNNFTGFPTNLILLMTESITCKDKTCLATAAYYTSENENNIQTAVMRSDDEGLTWTAKTVTPADSFRAHLKNIHCTHDSCIAVGDHQSRNLLFILRSQDKFQSYQQVTDITGFDTSAQLSSSIQSTCTDEYCVIAASQYDLYDDQFKPVFFFSGKDGLKWSAYTHLDEKAEEIHFTNISCSGNTCAAVGFSFERGRLDKRSKYKPLLYVSQDQGHTWNKKLIHLKSGILQSVKCQSNACIAIGNIPRQDIQGIVLVSRDHGSTWEMKNVANPNLVSLHISDVDCTNGFCVIGGSYYDTEAPNTLFLSVSYDQGNTWMQIKNAEGIPESTWVNSKGFSCNEENCLYTITVGKDSKRYMPIIMTSDVSGKNWRASTNIFNLPKDVQTMYIDVNYHENVR